MIICRTIEEFQSRYTRCVATIGKFDGVHRGHQAILKQLMSESEAAGLPAVVILVEPHPEEFFAKSAETSPARLTSLREKIELLRYSGIDCIYQLDFNLALSRQDAEVYIKDFLVAGLGVSVLIIGSDFRFGYRRSGDFGLLQDRGRQFGFKVVETATLEQQGLRVSSTLVRERLADGDFAMVEKLLGRAYAITGEVVRGRQLGADLGYPTCNIVLDRQRIPLHGVFACEVLWQAQTLIAAVNIGFRPTLNTGGDALLEAHILDFTAELYGEQLSVVFRHKLREELKFPDLDSLRRQIHADVLAVRNFFHNRQGPTG